MKNKKILKNYLEKNKSSPLLKTPEKDFHEHSVNHLVVSCVDYESITIATGKANTI